MAVRLLRPYAGQAVNTTYHGTDEAVLRNTGTADDNISLATDYTQGGRIVTTATASVSQFNLGYIMNSSSAQTLTIPLTGWAPLTTTLTIVQIGTGQTTVAPATGVTILTGTGGLNSKGQYAIFQLIKVASNTWVAYGGLGA